MITLEELFMYADIDDVGEAPDGTTELVFTLRGGGGNHEVIGEDLRDCLLQAGRIVTRHATLETIRREGLSDADIDRLADDSEAWQRGRIAGATEAAELIAEAGLKAARSTPAVAAAGEPIAVFGEYADEVGIPVTIYVPLAGHFVVH